MFPKLFAFTHCQQRFQKSNPKDRLSLCRNKYDGAPADLPTANRPLPEYIRYSSDTRGHLAERQYWSGEYHA